MTAVYTRRPRREQPSQGATVAAPNGACRALWDPLFGDVLNGAPQTLTGTLPTISNGLRAIQATTTSEYSSTPYLAKGLDTYVVYAIIRWDAADINSRTIVDIGGQIEFKGSINTNQVQTRYVSPNTIAGAATTFHGHWHVVAAKRVTGAWQTFAQVLGGPYLGTSTATGATSARVIPTSGNIRAGCVGPSSTWHISGGCALVYIDERFVPDAEILEVLANPWGLLEPRRIWVPVSAGGGASFNPAWVAARARTIGAGVI